MKRKTAFLVGFLVVLASQVADAQVTQQQFIVDGETGTRGPGNIGNGLFYSIGDAIAQASAGDIVKVRGMTVLGQPYPYKETPHPNHPNSLGGETFPLALKDGVQVIGIDGPTLIGRDGSSSSMEAMFKINIESVNQVYSLGKIRLLGGETGVLIDRGTSDGPVSADITLDRLTFIKNGTGIKAEMDSDATLDGLVITGCKFSTAADLGTLDARVPNLGISLRAEDDGVTPSKVVASIEALSLIGNFESTNLESDSALIDVHVQGTLGAWNQGTWSTISSVKLEIDSSVIDGRREVGLDRGWNYGIRARAQAQTPDRFTARNYRAAFVIECNGTEIRKFGTNGIQVSVDPEGKGEVFLKQGTLVSSCGKTYSGSPSGDGSGIAASCEGGYLGLMGRSNGAGGIAFHSVNNANCGVFAYSESTLLDTGDAWRMPGIPEGLFLGLEFAELSHNLSAGIFAKAIRTGIVGGTRTDLQGEVCFQGGSGYVEDGQGYLQDCRIHNNGEQGVSVELIDVQRHNGSNIPGAASFLTANSVNWGNDAEGMKVYCGDLDDFEGVVLTPVFYTTMADNSNPLGNINVDWSNAYDVGMKDIFAQPPCSLHTEHLRFVIWNSVFQTAGGTGPDFYGALTRPKDIGGPIEGVGERLYPVHPDINSVISSLRPKFVFAKGCRAVLPVLDFGEPWFRDKLDDFGSFNSTKFMWTRFGSGMSMTFPASPFVGTPSGPPDPNSSDPFQYMLDTSELDYEYFEGSVDSIGSTPDIWSMISSPFNAFVGGDLRTPLSGSSITESLNDKGASNDA